MVVDFSEDPSRPDLGLSSLEQEEVPRVHIDELSAERFFHEFLLPNRPVVILGVVEQWDVWNRWGPNSHQTAGDLDAFLADCGDFAVPDENFAVIGGEACCADQRPRFRPEKSTVREFLAERLVPEKEGIPESDPPYLKDWHLQRESERGGTGCYVPDLMADYQQKLPSFLGGSPLFDWLNSLVAHEEDYRFCYAGRQNSITPWHFDVMGSYSWSANLVGIKKWRLYSHKKLEQLLDAKRNVVVDVEEGGHDYVEVLQAPGELLFVPAFYVHDVVNLTDALSLNHNWLNACSLNHFLLPFLKAERALLVREIGEYGEGSDGEVADEIVEPSLLMQCACNYGLLGRLLDTGEKAAEEVGRTEGEEGDLRFFAEYTLREIACTRRKIWLNACSLNKFLLPFLKAERPLVVRELEKEYGKVSVEGVERDLWERCKCNYGELRRPDGLLGAGKMAAEEVGRMEGGEGDLRFFAEYTLREIAEARKKLKLRGIVRESKTS
eukprot:g6010.t1